MALGSQLMKFTSKDVSIWEINGSLCQYDSIGPDCPDLSAINLISQCASAMRNHQSIQLDHVSSIEPSLLIWVVDFALNQICFPNRLDGLIPNWLVRKVVHQLISRRVFIVTVIAILPKGVCVGSLVIVFVGVRTLFIFVDVIIVCRPLRLQGVVARLQLKLVLR